MSYIDARLDRKTDKIYVAEQVNGEREERIFPANYVFYYEDPSGSHQSIFGHTLSKFTTTSGFKFRNELDKHRRQKHRIFESDINPVFRCLADHYMNADVPTLNIGFFDIEADFHPVDGYALPDNPFNAVTAISLYRSGDQKLLSWVLRPSTVTAEAGQTIASGFTDTFMFDDEETMLWAFLDAITDIDVFTGWNSSAYDVPYLVNRIKLICGDDAPTRFCLWDQQPSKREYINKFDKPVTTFDFVGRVHLDYMELYAKHITQQRLSYSLDAISEIEIGDRKVPYEGNLDDRYKNDLVNFIEYNRQDVMLMVRIDNKVKFIELANQIAHANCVLLKTTMGSVALVEQAIINEMHAMNRIVPDRKEREIAKDGIEPSPVAGAYVANPKTGLHEHVGAVDINSLYPSAIRALNMSPETLIGQVRLDETMKLIDERLAKLPATQKAEAWEGLFCTLEVQHMRDRDDALLTVDFFDHLTDEKATTTMTGKELHDLLFAPDSNVCITANGTIFRTDQEGIVPVLLAKWYSERKSMQAKAKELHAQADQMAGVERLELKKQAMFWDQRQQTRKILLNSLYGALLNVTMRLFDQRIGQSVTLSGRSIVRHMASKINELVCGTYDLTGDAIIYGDTDSAYFSAYEALKDRPDFQGYDWSRERIIEMYDLIADATNETFPEFMKETFNTSLAKGAIIRAGRELVASTGLFIKKKKYAVLIYDLEGKRQDVEGKPGKLKAMGLDLKRSDTPRIMQKFLETLLMNLLTGKSKDAMYDDIREFRRSFKVRPGWEKGAPKKVANLTVFTNKHNVSNQNFLVPLQKDEKTRINTPGHVTASMNWNIMCELYNDRHATRITDSARIIVCKLLKNSYDMTSIAYPIDESNLPRWFRELPFDHLEMETKIIDNKLDNLVGVLQWDLTDTREKAGDEFFIFG